MTRAAADLDPAPRAFYALKGAATHARSALWLARGGPSRPGLHILFYHRVSDDRDELAVRPRRFREQMDFLAANGYRAVDVETAARLLDEGPPERAVGLSFDDGYADIADHALPVLAERGFSASVFLATGVTGGRASLGWYRRQPPLLSWDDVVRLDGDVFRFGAHTVTHPNLLTVGDEEARAEIGGSKDELEQRLGRDVETFCYPAGLFGERERRLVGEAGYSLACSCEPGPNTAATDRLALRRNQIDARDRLVDFRAKVAGAHDLPLPGRALYRRLRYSASSRSKRSR